MASESMPATSAKSVEILAHTTSIKKELKEAVPHETPAEPVKVTAIAPSPPPETQASDGKTKKRQHTITLGEAVYTLLQQSHGGLSEQTTRLHQELAEVKELIHRMDQRIQTQLTLPEVTAQPILIQDLPDPDPAALPYLKVLSHLETIVLDDELALDESKAKRFTSSLLEYNKHLSTSDQAKWRDQVELLIRPFSAKESNPQKVERYTLIQQMKWVILQHPPRH